MPATARFATRKPGTRQEYIRVDLQETEHGLEAIAYPEQSSGVLSSVSASRGLAIIPPATLVSEGDSVRVLLLDLLA